MNYREYLSEGSTPPPNMVDFLFDTKNNVLGSLSSVEYIVKNESDIKFKPVDYGMVNMGNGSNINFKINIGTTLSISLDDISGKTISGNKMTVNFKSGSKLIIVKK